MRIWLKEWQAESLSEPRMHDLVVDQERLRVEVVKRGQGNRERMRHARGRVLPNFAVEEYVMVARVRMYGRTPKP